MKIGTRKHEGRWIRPADPGPRPSLALPGSGDLDTVAGVLLAEARRRVSGLAALERELEDRIHGRWQEAEAEAAKRLALAEEEASAVRKRSEGEAKEAALRAEREGRSAGNREGFARGREEGYRLGYEEGRHDGLREGHDEGESQAVSRIEKEMAGARTALVEAAIELRSRKDDLFREARKGVLDLAVAIARKIVKREVEAGSDAVLRNVEKAVDLVFRRGSVLIQVHPEDAPAVEKALAGEPRWAEGFKGLEVRPAADVARGGCRLISGSGSVDLAIETQLSLIAAAIEGASGEPAAEEAGVEGVTAAVDPAAGRGREGRTP
jgi:flagellar assembly protein FliH